MLITKEIEIDMAHRVPNHKSKCRNLHGHRYKIEVGVEGKLISKTGDSSEGMVIDFSDLKEVMMEVIDKPFDHGAVFYDKDPFGTSIAFISGAYQDEKKMHLVDFIPTAENLAIHWHNLLLGPLYMKGISLTYVKVWETPTSTAIFNP